MKEFIEKLIERLNEKAKWVAYSNFDRDIGITHKVAPFEDIRNIVNELAEEYKPKTQADKIRSMSDEELAELFAKLAWNSEVQTTPLKYLDWLQSEVE